MDADIGYKGEIGYQTFLYSNEPEIRSLLMFLVEKLPRETSEASDQPTGKSAVLHRAIAAAINAQLAVSWVPLNCILPLHCETQVQQILGSLLIEVKEYQRDILLPVTTQFPSQSSMVSSILEQHTAELSNTQERDTEWKSQGLLSRLTPQEYHSKKLTRLCKRIKEQLRSAAAPSPESVFSVSRSTSELSDLLQTFRGSGQSDFILNKGTHFTHTQKFTFTQEAAATMTSVNIGRQSGSEPQLQQQEELACLLLQFQQLCNDTDQIAADMKYMRVTTTQVFDELKQRELENAENKKKMQVKKKTIDLLPDADNNLQKLQSEVEESASRVVNLASQWEKHRAPLIEELRRLREICSSKSSTKLSEIKSLHEKIRMATEEAKKKEESYKQLVTELESLPQDVSRSAYTQRILEIVGNIKKQKEEITKILSDTKELQKEINSLTGKLDRTFAVTDELVFKDAKKDESVRKSYKYLAALHENCNQLIQTIEDSGTILREIRDLEEQIETENCNKTVANLERIQDDYKAIRQENSALAAKVREG
uniref:Coiled-coil domain-containing protein 22 n=1 Tax=Fundulus heteroclitus TaxID=8078 RepID=A0A3Q2QVP4_FUNHE